MRALLIKRENIHNKNMKKQSQTGKIRACYHCVLVVLVYNDWFADFGVQPSVDELVTKEFYKNKIKHLRKDDCRK